MTIKCIMCLIPLKVDDIGGTWDFFWEGEGVTANELCHKCASKVMDFIVNSASNSNIKKELLR